MKKIVCALFVLLGSASISIAQDTAPEEAQAAFKTKYPKAKNVEWVKTGDNQWQAEFVANERDIEVVFDERGTWLGTQTEMDPKKAPEAVKKAVAEKYKGYTISELAMVEIHTGEVMYKYELDKGDGEIQTMFHADGRIVTQSQNIEETEEDMEDEGSED